GSQDGTARLWDPITGQQLRCLERQSGDTLAMFTGQGRQVLTACTNQNVCLWDATSGQRIQLFKDAGDVAGCDEAGHWLVTAGKDRSVRIYDLSSSKKLSEKKLEWLCNSVTVSADGRYAALSGYSRQVEVFELPDWRRVPLTPVESFSVLW